MTTQRSRTQLKRAAIAGCIVCIACAESPSATITESPLPAVEAGLVLSDSAPRAGDSLTVFVKATVKSPSVVGSFTAQIAYDATSLRYEGEAAGASDGLRASNAVPGKVRIAGAAADGFVGGELGAYRFTVLERGGAKSITLSIDELHLATRLDVRNQLTLAPIRVIGR
jgi:hypothetical protein